MIFQNKNVISLLNKYITKYQQTYAITRLRIFTYENKYFEKSKDPALPSNEQMFCSIQLISSPNFVSCNKFHKQRRKLNSS